MDRTPSVSDELGPANFGDKRLSQRLRKIVDAAAKNPASSLPEITNSVAGLEATYRFLGNPKVTPERILQGHVEATVQRACLEKRVAIAHDTTPLLFGGTSRRQQLGWVSQGNQGFLGHFALAVSRGSVAQPLGILGFQPVFRSGEPKEKKKRGKADQSSNRESLRWWNLADATQSLFPLHVSPIHVMDREADDFELFAELCGRDMRFVIRIVHNRGCKIPGKKDGKLFDLIDGLSVICEREITISKRGRSRLPRDRKIHGPRAGRAARLHMTAGTVELSRTNGASGHYPATLKLNCVHVYEVNVPKDAEPVNWKLFTTEPIRNAEDILNIVDDYRARWMIEEFFKALKTGCAYEKRQLEGKKSLLNALAVFAPIAWQLLLLRTLNRQQPDTPAKAALTKDQIDVLKAVSKKEISDHPTIDEALAAIAALGGHIPNNGPPGWQVLGRGMEKLLTMEVAWIAAKERCDQS